MSVSGFLPSSSTLMRRLKHPDGLVYLFTSSSRASLLSVNSVRDNRFVFRGKKLLPAMEAQSVYGHASSSSSSHPCRLLLLLNINSIKKSHFFWSQKCDLELIYMCIGFTLLCWLLESFPLWWDDWEKSLSFKNLSVITARNPVWNPLVMQRNKQFCTHFFTKCCEAVIDDGRERKPLRTAWKKGKDAFSLTLWGNGR